jgi:hypothetical protein
MTFGHLFELTRQNAIREVFDGYSRYRYKSIYTYIFKPTEKPMKLEDAIAIVRYGKRGYPTKPGREKLIREANDIVRKRAEELLLAAEKKAEAERVLVDIETYPDAFIGNAHNRWVKRTFSDGSITKALANQQYAEHLKYTFEQGKKAGAAKVPRFDDFD